MISCHPIVNLLDSNHTLVSLRETNKKKKEDLLALLVHSRIMNVVDMHIMSSHNQAPCQKLLTDGACMQAIRYVGTTLPVLEQY